MKARGRSREVSRAALARKSSEERLSRAHEVKARRQHSGGIPVVHATSRKSPPKLEIPHQPFDASAALAPQPLEEVIIRNSEVVVQPLAPAEVAPTPIEPMPVATFPPSPVPSPSTSASQSMSPQPSSNDHDYYDYFYCDSPPSPPHTIEDQLHVAYAHDDIHLAKILLLKLRGIEVTSNDDPRIAAVQDEDFDECFLPNGMLLLTEEEEQRVKEAQRLEVERIQIELERRALRERERKRELWEKRCEKIWENEKLRLQEEKARMKLARLRQEQQYRAQQQELEARRPVTLSRSRKPKLSYNSLSQTRASSASSTPEASPSGYTYSFVVTPVLQMPPSRHTKMKAGSSRAKARREYPPSTSDYSTDTTSDGTGFDASGPTVLFKEVITAMNGSLFPLTASERAHSLSRSSKSVSTLKHHHKLDPLDVLLDSEATSWAPEERLRRRLDKAPHKDDNQPSGWTREGPCTMCRTNSLSSSISSPTSATSDNSDLSSFSSLASSMTDITTPPASPPSSDIPLVQSLAEAMRPFTSQTPEPGSSSCRCIRPVSRLITIHPSQGPLFIPPLPAKSEVLSSPSPSPKSLSSQRLPKARKASISSISSIISTRSNSKLGQHVSRFIQLAKGFQNAYMHAMVYSVVPNCDDSYRDDPIQTPAKMKKMRLMPDGYRASKEQVTMFISNISVDSLESSSTPPTFIALGNGVDAPQHTVLKHPLPYRTLLKRDLEPLISPFLRAHQQEHVAKSQIRRNEPLLDPGDDSEFRRVISRSRSKSPDLEPRKRFIRNPVYMRVKAIQGAVWERGGVWDAPRVRAGKLSCAKERILVFTTAFVGDSPLGIHHRPRQDFMNGTKG